VRDGQLHLADDGEVVLQEQVEVAVDAAADRVLDRQDAVRRLAAGDGGKDRLERLGSRSAWSLNRRAAASL
jgi:hypothetical protein